MCNLGTSGGGKSSQRAIERDSGFEPRLCRNEVLGEEVDVEELADAFRDQDLQTCRSANDQTRACKKILQGAAVPDKLSTYRAKRDFRQTAEPRGARSLGAPAATSTPALRFVIQKHAARRLHYDLRLELDGVFKSWAVTRGPSLNPADKRLAVEVEDHPLEYGDFEGTIPQGQYGGGTVQLWDRGYWQPLPGEPPAQALRAGELKFMLDGERLHGSWVLVRIRNDRSGSKRSNWLLIKHRDEAADPAHAATLLEEDRSVASGRSMSAIAAGKGKAPKPFMQRRAPKADAVWQPNGSQPPAAAAAKSASATKAKAAPKKGPLPAFIEPQLCTLVDRPPPGPEWVHEIKLDGYRLQLRVERSKARLLTRRGLDWTRKFPELARAAQSLPDCIIDGEVVALTAKRVPSFANLQAALSEHDTAPLTFFAFDMLFLKGQDLRSLPLSARKQRLEATLAHVKSPNIRYLEHFQADAAQVLQSACTMQLEGIVSKRIDAPYASGRAGGWTKVKCRAGHEVVIGGYTSREGSVRSLLVGVHRDERLVYVGRVGTGFGQRVAEPLQTALKRIHVIASPFSADQAPRVERDVHWVKPKLVAEIEFAGWTDSGMVRQAAFKGLRADKAAESVQAERPAKLRRADLPTLPRKSKSTRSAAAAPPADDEDTILGVQISQPAKSLWPDAGDGRPVSKLELACYFESIGEWMIAHIEGRPCSLVRAPDGIGKQHFFQRHAMPGQSKLFKMITISGDRKPYLAIDRVEGLIAAAQSAALELHPWNCEPHAPEVPGRLVFDLDPAPDVAFSAVITAANELRERLEQLGLATFCKTTGGKGLHVVTPLVGRRDKLDWAAAKTFAQALCARMAADSPDRFLMSMAKNQRGGRIFLDYLRNDRMSTAVAPLSPRARAGALISMPLHWSQVRAGLDAARFTVRTAPALLTAGKPWDDYAHAARSLRAAIARFTRAATGARASRRRSSKARASMRPGVGVR
jgi:bifunctional non-homologous end joining protein LigD